MQNSSYKFSSLVWKPGYYADEQDSQNDSPEAGDTVLLNMINREYEAVELGMRSSEATLLEHVFSKVTLHTNMPWRTVPLLWIFVFQLSEK